MVTAPRTPPSEGLPPADSLAEAREHYRRLMAEVPDHPDRFSLLFDLMNRTYRQDVEPQLSDANPKIFVALNVVTGDFECDADSAIAIERLAERTDSRFNVLTRVGLRPAEKIRSFRGRS
jgi:hypothetical protein